MKRNDHKIELKNMTRNHLETWNQNIKKTIWLKLYMKNNMETWKTWKHGQTWQQGNMEHNLSGEKIDHGMLRTCRPQGVDPPVGDPQHPQLGDPHLGAAGPQHPKHSNQIQQIK